MAQELSNRILHDVQGSISFAIATGEFSFITDVIRTLKKLGLYPYKIQLRKFIPHFSFRKTIIDIMAMLYPVEFFIYVYGGVFYIKRKITGG